MNKNQIQTLQNALNALSYQLDNHQQNKAVELNAKRLISEFSAEIQRNQADEMQNALNLLIGAICDEKGLGRLNLMLHNAKVPPKYYDIFYQMLAYGGGGGEVPAHTCPENEAHIYHENQVPICIDCGAHAGLISDIALYCGAELYASEPNIHLQGFLRRKLGGKNAHLYQKAVGGKNYTTSFLVFQGRALSQGNRIVPSVQDGETAQSYEVEVIDLCEFIEQNFVAKGREVYLLKLDVEGAEFEILDKLIAKKLYKHIKFIACEMHEYMFEDGEQRLERLKNLLAKEGINNILLDWC